MALEQRKFSSAYIREHEIPEVPEKLPQIKPSRKKVSKGEKFLFVLFSTILVLFTTMILHTDAQINEVNREVQVLGKDIEGIMKENKELSIEIKEKSTYDKVWKKAKELGLDMNENNVKVVPGR
ncbi:cell division protein FtsL [Sporosarcina sp. CAU 1771]